MNFEYHKTVADASEQVFNLAEDLAAVAETRHDEQAAVRLAVALGELEAVAARLRQVMMQMQPAFAL